MNTKTLIALDKAQKKAVEFVKRFTTKDDARPVLTVLNVKDNVFRAADGFILTVAKVDGLEIPDGNYKQDGNYLSPVEDELGNYPDVAGVIPNFDVLRKQENNCVIEFFVDPSLLRKALDETKGVVKITVASAYGKSGNTPICIQTRADSENPSFSLVMPMYQSGNEEWADAKNL